MVFDCFEAMGKVLLIVGLLLVSTCFCVAQGVSADSSFVSKDTASLQISHPAIPHMLPNTLFYDMQLPAYGRYGVSEINLLPNGALDLETAIKRMNEISYNVNGFIIPSYDRWHLFKRRNAHFLSGLMPGLIPDAVIGGEPYFDYNIFLDKNFDQRVYNPKGIYNRPGVFSGTLHFPKSSSLPPILR